MSDVYRLVFRGEVLEGQHPAVVRKRLGEAGGFAADALDKLFSGRPVVVKREADTATAARYQALFRKAGARLRVLPVEAAASAEAATPAPTPPADEDGLMLLPAGSDVLTPEERPPSPEREVDTSALSLADGEADLPEAPAAPAVDAPDYTVAEVGSVLGDPRPAPAPASAPDFGLAEAGSRLAPPAAAPAAAVNLAEVSFEVAPAGEALDQRPRATARKAPDTSHLALEKP